MQIPTTWANNGYSDHVVINTTDKHVCFQLIIRIIVIKPF